MGNWNINIQGIGCHHNKNHPDDADVMAHDFVRRLQNAGHTIECSTFTSGRKENLLTGVGPIQIDAVAARLYSTYCREVGGKAFNGDPLPEWHEFATDPNKQLQVEAWRSVARNSLVQ